MYFAELAPECASAYFRYGAALLYQAQESADVFGADLGSNAYSIDKGDKENYDESKSQEKGYENALNDDSHDKGKAPVEDSTQLENPLDNEVGDLQLAWENLEAARAIWSKDDKNAAKLVDVYQLLGDVAMENESFEDALEDFNSALKAAETAGMPKSERRVAEIHFKRSIVLHYLGKLEEALQSVKCAIESLDQHKAKLIQEDTTSEESVKQVDVILDELQTKVEELESALKEMAATKEAMKGVFQEYAKTGNNVKDSPIKDLGIVGRGQKRINLVPEQELPTANPSVAANNIANKKQRSLETLMRPNQNASMAAGQTVIGFGNSKQSGEVDMPAFLTEMKEKSEGKEN